MNDFNRTHAGQTHRTSLASSQHVSDRTRLYIFFWLFILLSILSFYLLYNFISYKRYLSARKSRWRKKKSSSCLFDWFATCRQRRERLYSYEKFSLPSYQIPLRPIVTEDSSPTPSQFVSEF